MNYCFNTYIYYEPAFESTLMAMNISMELIYMFQNEELYALQKQYSYSHNNIVVCPFYYSPLYLKHVFMRLRLICNIFFSIFFLSYLCILLLYCFFSVIPHKVCRLDLLSFTHVHSYGFE